MSEKRIKGWEILCFSQAPRHCHPFFPFECILLRLPSYLLFSFRFGRIAFLTLANTVSLSITLLAVAILLLICLAPIAPLVITLLDIVLFVVAASFITHLNGGTSLQDLVILGLIFDLVEKTLTSIPSSTEFLFTGQRSTTAEQ